MSGRLVIIPTPIGNLGDITLRALDVLKSADLIACEDTRTARRLLVHFGISKPLVSYFEQNRVRRADELLAKIQTGSVVALVSEAGTPGISDPGSHLVRAALERNIVVECLPGPCALVPAVVMSGFNSGGFVFLGFLPRKPGKLEHALKDALALGETVAAYESPHRIIRTLGILAEKLGDPDTALSREMTKKFEETIRGPASVVLKEIMSRPKIGELTLCISPRRRAKISGAEK